MNRIDAKFAELRGRGEAALIPFISAGDPDLATTLKIMRALDQSGADSIELGVRSDHSTCLGTRPKRGDLSLRRVRGCPGFSSVLGYPLDPLWLL